MRYMKYALLVLLTFTSFVSFGQTAKHVDTLSFCRNKYPVPTGCTAESEYQVKCDNYSMTWIYMNEQMLQTMPEQFISQMTQQMKDLKKELVNYYLLGKEAKGYRLSFKTKSGEKGYQLIGYGTANGQPVIVQLALDKEPKTNNDLPEFARQIITIQK